MNAAKVHDYAMVFWWYRSNFLELAESERHFGRIGEKEMMANTKESSEMFRMASMILCSEQRQASGKYGVALPTLPYHL